MSVFSANRCIRWPPFAATLRASSSRHGRSVSQALASALAIIVLAACSHSRDTDVNAPKSGADEHTEGAREKSETLADGSGAVKVSADAQRALHVQIERLAETSAPRELPGFGRVLDPQALAASVSEWAAARSAAAASEQEWERLKMLEKQNTASIRALQAAEAAATHDRLLAQSIHDRIELTWGRALVHRADLTELVRALSAQDRVTVRVDLPGGEGAASEPLGVRLTTMTAPGKAMQARYLGLAPTTDPQLQGRGFLFLTEDNPLNLTPGAAVSASLELSGGPLRGVFLPGSAVLYNEGKAWVYLQRDPTSFARTPVLLGPVVPGGWLVSQGLQTGDRAVTQGAQLLLSEELKPLTRLPD